MASSQDTTGSPHIPARISTGLSSYSRAMHRSIKSRMPAMCSLPSTTIAPEVTRDNSPDRKSLPIPDHYRTTDAQHLEPPKKIRGE